MKKDKKDIPVFRVLPGGEITAIVLTSKPDRGINFIKVTDMAKKRKKKKY